MGFDSNDDAAVYKINEDTAMIQTVDFFPPMVDDPYSFGQIAAANALSDVYAMGGKPVLAMNLLTFPNCLPLSVVEGILQGGASKVLEAGAVIAGAILGGLGMSLSGCGHSVNVTPDRAEVCKDGACLVLEPGRVSFSQVQPVSDVSPVVKQDK